MDRKSYSPAVFLERFVALEVRAAGLIFGAAVFGVMLATFGDSPAVEALAFAKSFKFFFSLML